MDGRIREGGDKREKGKEEVGEREGRGGMRKRGEGGEGGKGGNGSGPDQVLEEMDVPGVSRLEHWHSRNIRIVQ